MKSFCKDYSKRNIVDRHISLSNTKSIYLSIYLPISIYIYRVCSIPVQESNRSRVLPFFFSPSVCMCVCLSGLITQAHITQAGDSGERRGRAEQSTARSHSFLSGESDPEARLLLLLLPPPLAGGVVPPATMTRTTALLPPRCCVGTAQLHPCCIVSVMVIPVPAKA